MYTHCFLKHGLQNGLQEDLKHSFNKNDCQQCQGNVLTRPADLENACFIMSDFKATYKIDVKQLSQTIRCQIIYPDSLEYNSARLNYNKTINVFPGAIILAKTTNDIAETISWAKQYQVPFRIRSGKHAQYPASVLNIGLVIDLSQMTKSTVYKDRCLVQVGTTLGPLLEKLSLQELIFPVGTCPTNGLAGLTLGGGFGLLQRQYGLTMDSLVSITFVDASGKVQKVTKGPVWNALKGAGGGNFGVVTLFEFKLQRLPRITTISYKLTFDGLVECIELFQRRSYPNSITLELNLFKDHLLLLGSSLESPGKTKSILKLYEPYATEMKIEVKSCNQFCQWMAEGGYARPPFFENRTTFVHDPLPKSAIKVLREQLKKSEVGERISLLLMGGLINGLDNKLINGSDNGSFPYRDSLYWIQIFSTWENNLFPRKEWVVETLNLLKPYLQHYRNTIPLYVNFLDYDLPKEQALLSYFERNVPWLKQIKHLVDPENVFNFEQSI